MTSKNASWKALLCTVCGRFSTYTAVRVHAAVPWTRTLGDTAVRRARCSSGAACRALVAPAWQHAVLAALAMQVAPIVPSSMCHAAKCEHTLHNLCTPFIFPTPSSRTRFLAPWRARQNPCSQSEGATSTMRASSAPRAATTHQTPAGLQNVAKPLLLRPSTTARSCAPAAAVAPGQRGSRLLVGRSRLLAWPPCSASRKETQVRVLWGVPAPRAHWQGRGKGS